MKKVLLTLVAAARTRAAAAAAAAAAMSLNDGSGPAAIRIFSVGHSSSRRGHSQRLMAMCAQLCETLEVFGTLV